MQDLHAQLADQVAYLVVRDGSVVSASPDVSRELGCDPAPLLGPFEQIGRRLDDGDFDDVLDGAAELRVRLGPDLESRPVRLRRLAAVDGEVLVEIRSLADEFRLEALLRRSTVGHMLLTPDVELLWSMTSNDLAEVFPGDDPLEWVDLMDRDDMEELGRAIHAVGADPAERRTVRHRLEGDRTYTVLDIVESAVHDPDLGGVLVRSRLEDSALADSVGTEPYRGMTVSDHMPIGVVVASEQGRVLHRNAAAAELIGVRAGQSLVPIDDEPWVFEACDAEQASQLLGVFTAATAGTAGHCTVDSPIDRRRGLRLSASPSAGATVVLTVEDTTELLAAERALRASKRLLEALDDHSEDFVIVLDAGGRSRYISSSARRVIGADVTIRRITDLLRFVDEADHAQVREKVREVRSTAGTSAAVELRLDLGRGDGVRWHQGTMTNLIDDPDVQGIVLTLRDAHDRHVAETELRFRATHDALTTLPDRAAIESRLAAVLAEGEQSGARTALVFCDVDNFKQINDRAGHRVGDLVLTEVARRLRAAIRATDFVGRFGGDEFVVVAPDVEDEEHALLLAERVFEAVRGAVECDGTEIDVTVSMGVALSDAGCATTRELVHRADLAMYESKRLGRGLLSAYRPDLGTERTGRDGAGGAAAT